MFTITMSEKEKRFYSMAEFAKEIDVSYKTVLSMVYEGRVKYKRFAPRTIRIPASELDVR